jgi:hypothetical protein
VAATSDGKDADDDDEDDNADEACRERGGVGALLVAISSPGDSNSRVSAVAKGDDVNGG